MPNVKGLEPAPILITRSHRARSALWASRLGHPRWDHHHGPRCHSASPRDGRYGRFQAQCEGQSGPHRRGHRHRRQRVPAPVRQGQDLLADRGVPLAPDRREGQHGDQVHKRPRRGARGPSPVVAPVEHAAGRRRAPRWSPIRPPVGGVIETVRGGRTWRQAAQVKTDHQDASAPSTTSSCRRVDMRTLDAMKRKRDAGLPAFGLITGPAGTAKTRLAQAWAFAHDLPVVIVDGPVASRPRPTGSA